MEAADVVVTCLFLIVIGFGWYFYALEKAGPVYKPKPCKPHAWQYVDSEGWLTETSPNLEERLKSAVLVCKNCRKHPSEDSGSKHGEYE